MGKDYYNILGVEKGAGDDEIKKAYRKMAHKHHPDKAGGDEAKFKEVNEAYQVLSDRQKRQQYDQFGTTFDNARSGGGSGFEGFDFSNFSQGFEFNFGGGQGGFEDIFSDIFGSGQRGGRTRERVGQDIAMDVEISFEEMAKGVERELKLYKRVPCPSCDGTGAENKATKTCPTCKGSGKVQKTVRSFLGTFNQMSVCPECQGKGQVPEKKCKQCGGDGVVRDYANVKINIPSGIEDGQIIKLSGYGELPTGGGRAGDLYLTVHVQPHARYTRQGNDIYVEQMISFSQAALGDKIETQTIDETMKLKIPAGIQSGTLLKIKGSGIVKMNGFGRGDHYVKVVVKTPESLSRDQRRLMEKLKEEGI